MPILVDPGLGLRNLGRCLIEAEPTAFVGIPQANLARKILGWARGSIKTVVSVRGARGELGDLTHNGEPGPVLCPVEPEEMAAILFTSGSTGVPKGVVYTHSVFHNQVELLRSTYGIEPGEVDLSTFPLFALYGPILGMTCVIPSMNFTRPGRVNPSSILGPIKEFGVTNLFGSPALIRRVGSRGVDLLDSLPSLRRVISAGAPVPARVLDEFSSLLQPEVQIFTPYGATESLPVCSIGSNEILRETRFQTEQGAGVCVGRPVDPMRVEIIGITDEPIPQWSDDLLLPDGTIGEIVVSGPVVTRSYYHRPEATALAKIEAKDRFFHRMGDVGYRDKTGRIWFCGRKSHRVHTSEGTLFTIPCEGIFNNHPEVSRSALVGVGGRPVLCVEPRTRLRSRDRERVRRDLLEIGSKYPMTRSINTILFHRAFPVDIRHNAKIFREKLADWAGGVLR